MPEPDMNAALAPSTRTRGRQVRWIFIFSAAVVLLWLMLDFSTARRHSLKDFDPYAVAQIETQMWRSYYDHHSLALFFELAHLLRAQYHFSITRSWLGAYYAAHAAVVFQRGAGRPDYEKALPDLFAYYSLIQAGSDTPFDLQQVPRLELEWWIVHRQRAEHAPGDLPESLAALQAGIYHKPVQQFSAHAQARADAMILRDSWAASGGVSDRDWNRINQLLNTSWLSLKKVVTE